MQGSVIIAAIVLMISDRFLSGLKVAGFKQWLMEIAQVVAEADKERSHFGIGGVKVTDKEKAALAEIKSYLGLSDG